MRPRARDPCTSRVPIRSGLTAPRRLDEHGHPSCNFTLPEVHTLSLEQLPAVYLARHGETEWTVSGRHTGRTDLPLTAHGELEAHSLEARLRGMTFALVLTSPLRRAVQTCKGAGFIAVAKVEPDLREWDYGDYEGRTSADIHAHRPGWQLFRDGCPGGESPQEVGARADQVIRRIRAAGGDVLLFSSGHFMRVFAARWLGLEPTAGRYFLLSTASLSIVGYEHDLSEPAIRLWDENPQNYSKWNRPAIAAGSLSTRNSKTEVTR